MRASLPAALYLVCAVLAPGLCLPGAEAVEPKVAGHPIMAFSQAQMFAHRLRHTARPEAAIRPEALFSVQQALTAGDTTVVNLLHYFAYSPVTWNQGGCGDCWVWGSTAACSITYGAHTGSPALFSVQYLNSTYNGGQDTSTSSWACCGGNQETFAAFYETGKKFIPWSNSNAAYSDLSSSCSSSAATKASAIALTPNVPFTSITDQVITTTGVTQAQAISNLKAILNGNQAIAFSFFLPGAGWTDFFSFWDNAAKNTPWADIDKFSGSTWDSGAGGHLVCIVGYDDTDNTWIKIPQAMGYSDYINYDGWQFDQYEFDVYDIAWPTSPNTMTAHITAPAPNSTVLAGATTPFTGVGSDSSTSAEMSYAWSFGDGSTATGSSANHAYTNTGTSTLTETVTLNVLDNSGGHASTSSTVFVAPKPKNTVTATITTPATSVTVASGSALGFAGTATDSSTAATLSYAWTFGDASSATGKTASHTYSNLGTSTLAETVTLTVTDSTGIVAIATRTVSVTPKPRTVTATIATPAATETVAAGGSVAFSGRATDSSSVATLTYAWNFGDGSSAAGASANHTFSNPGTSTLTRTVTFTATDNGGTVGSVTRTISVAPAPAPRNTVTATITSPSMTDLIWPNLLMSLAGKATDSSPSATLTYVWNFGDGTSGTGAAPTHTYTNKGTSVATYTATLTATDSTGVVATATRTIMVKPPQAK